MNCLSINVGYVCPSDVSLSFPSLQRSIAQKEADLARAQASLSDARAETSAIKVSSPCRLGALSSRR